MNGIMFWGLIVTIFILGIFFFVLWLDYKIDSLELKLKMMERKKQ